MDMPVYAAVHNTQLFSIKTSFLSESHNASAPILDLFSLPPLLISVRSPPMLPQSLLTLPCATQSCHVDFTEGPASAEKTGFDDG
jgi:hypothetical protein